MRNYLTEFIGTFFLVLTAALTLMNGTPLAPLAIGSALMIMVYMGGHVSGAHYNPAVSLAVLLRRRMSLAEFLAYAGSQIAGATVAALVAYAVVGRTVAPRPADGISLTGALVIELLFTFALALVVLNSAASAKTQGNSFYGLAIGFTIVVAAFAGGPLSGGAFNPALAIGMILVDTGAGAGNAAALWIYLVGTLAGAALAAFVFGLQEREDPAEMRSDTGRRSEKQPA
jgi:aquaporin Z